MMAINVISSYMPAKCGYEIDFSLSWGGMNDKETREACMSEEKLKMIASRRYLTGDAMLKQAGQLLHRYNYSAPKEHELREALLSEKR
jgi:hypothetical protein